MTLRGVKRQTPTSQASWSRLCLFPTMMSEENVGGGTNWTSVELDLIVADYFTMLAEDWPA